MSHRGPGDDAMMQGYRSLEDACAELELTLRQRLHRWVLLWVIHVYRRVILPLRRRRVAALYADLRAVTDIPLRAAGSASTSPHFLDAERRAFERDGIIGPFPAMTPDEAGALADHVRAAFETDYDGHTYINGELKAALKRHGAWNNQMAGLYQALRMPRLRAALRRPAIADRLAGILGDSVMCWRSQFFEKPPGAEGTFWHQNSTFRESAAEPKLRPTRSIDPPLVQLTVWMALTDTTRETAALRILPGTFTDGRMERLYTVAMDEQLLFLSLLPPERLSTFVTVARFSTGNFIRAQAVFEAALGLLGEDPFAGRPVRDLVMRAGECVIFTSLNMHASFANTTADQTRLAFVGRCAATHVAVTPQHEFPTPEGTFQCDLPDVTCFQVHGDDPYGVNRIMVD